MKLVKIGDRYFNMDLLIEAHIQDLTRVVLKFAAPSPAGVGASDWSVGPYEVKLVGLDGHEAARWLAQEGGGS